MFAPVFYPFNGPAQLHGNKWYQHFFWIEHHNLGAEAAADIGRDHAHFMFRQVKDGGQSIANGQGSLR